MVRVLKTFAKTFVASIFLIIGVMALWFVLVFIILGPLFAQLFGDLVYFGRDRVWIYSILVIIGSFLFLSAINYLIIGRLTKERMIHRKVD